MSSFPVLPLFLQKGKLSSLNDQLFKRTGCFAFIGTDLAVCATCPASWQDAFSIIVPGLYSVYHDYACKFLEMLLDDRNLGFQPDGFTVPRYLMSHKITVEQVLRPNITHGILYLSERDRFQNKISDFYLAPYYSTKGIKPQKFGKWPSLIECINEEQWEYIVMRIVDDSNSLYNHLLNWSIEWEKYPSELPNLKKQFSADKRFVSSFDARVCSPIVKACLKEANKSLKLANCYYNDKNNSAPINNWQREMVKCFLNGDKPDKLYAELQTIIRNEIVPKPNQSSLAIANMFNLP